VLGFKNVSTIFSLVPNDGVSHPFTSHVVRLPIRPSELNRSWPKRRTRTGPFLNGLGSEPKMLYDIISRGETGEEQNLVSIKSCEIILNTLFDSERSVNNVQANKKSNKSLIYHMKLA